VILASGILSVAVPPRAVNAVDQLVSVPVVPIAKVIPVFVSSTVFPTRVIPVPKISTFSLVLNVFQSVAERAPVVDVPARAREIPVPAIERPLAVPIVPTLLLKVFQSVEDSHQLAVVVACTIAFCFVLKVFQSIELKYPFVLVVACPIANTPVVLSYVSGPRAERLVSQILFDTVPESDRISVLVVESHPERVTISQVAVARFELVVMSDPESTHILLLMFAIVPERASCARLDVK
jgi:hypothetical protein